MIIDNLTSQMFIAYRGKYCASSSPPGYLLSVSIKKKKMTLAYRVVLNIL